MALQLEEGLNVEKSGKEEGLGDCLILSWG